MQGSQSARSIKARKGRDVILKPFIPWVGGKTALRPILYQLFPNQYDRLVEVFGGGAQADPTLTEMAQARSV